MQKEEIAIIGMGCRFPGKLKDVESFWRFLLEGRDAVEEVPADRWNKDRFYDAEPGLAGKTIAKEGGFLDDIDQFDPQFFGISPREAPYIDPQQRLLLETAWEAMESAGIVLDRKKGTNIGVYVGVSHTDYQNIQCGANERTSITPHSPTGNAHSVAANRISYCFNLTGPSLAMDTACSSALTAVHIACEQLLNGRCEVALAGGVTVMITPDGFIGFSQAGMLSPDGRCKAFDASANGFVRGEGAGMVALKPLKKAMADGDPIHAVILGSSANQDGSTNGISLPSAEAQARLVKDACTEAGIHPNSIGYVEAHGTGTAVGDPIEAHALAEALCRDRPADAPLPMGSVKTNLGHLETAAGIASLIKGVLIVSRGKIPPSLHFNEPSPHIDFDACKLRIPTEVESFPCNRDGRRLAGVNSFGFGGANTHVILGDPPQAGEASDLPNLDWAWPVVLSARSEESLRAGAKSLATWLDTHGTDHGSCPLMPDIVYSLGARRNHHPYRLTTIGRSLNALATELRAYASEGEAGPAVRTSFTPVPEHPPCVGFVMSGQGPQWWGMGRELMRSEPVFRETMETCAKAMEPHAKFSLIEELARDEEESRLQQTAIGQPAIFAMQYALAQLWKSWGVDPAVVTGHSVGEIAAACVAGILTMEEAARIIVIRGQVMHDCARGDGTMLAVAVSDKEATRLIAEHDPVVSIAAFNGPASLTLSGPRESLEAIQGELEAREIFARFVRVDHPFHHAFMQPAADAIKEALADLVPKEETVPFVSTVSGTIRSGKDCTAQHWADGIRQPVQFVSAVNAAHDRGVDIWLEISAHPALSVSIQECLTTRDAKVPVIPSARREREQESNLEAALELHRLGVELDFAAMTPSRTLLSLPTYAWNKARWWHESEELRHSRLAPGGKGLLDLRMPRSNPTWIARFDERHLAYLRDHRVETHVIFPAAGFVEMVLEAGVELFEGRPFAIEDFEIRKPLILSDPSEGLVLELTYDPGQRAFSIQSHVEPVTTWSVHVVGSLRSERVESSFATTRWTEPDASLEKVEPGEFYRYMADLGLRYGPEFRAIRELNAGGGESSGLVSLSEKTNARAGEYVLHPVILDAALHVFSAAAHTVEDRRAAMKLPLRFSRILFNKTPGATSRVKARVFTCNKELIEGRIGIYDVDGQPAVLVDGFRAVALSAAKRPGSGGGKGELVYHVDWERSEPEPNPIPLAPVPLKELFEAATKAKDEVLQMRGTDRLESVMACEDKLAAAHVAKGLIDLGVDPAGKETFDADSLRVAESMREVFHRLMAKMNRSELLESQEGGWCATGSLVKAAESVAKMRRDFFTRFPGHVPEGRLCEATGADFAAIMRGEKDAVQVLFSGSRADVLEHFYGDGLFASHWMSGIGAALREAASRLPEGRGLRILEVGAGTGGLAAYVLPLLERNLHSYVFTDVSAGFFLPAQQKLANFGEELEFQAFDLDKSPADQDFEMESFDFIVGTNVLHAVADVRRSLASLHGLLKPGGTLVFMDIANPQMFVEAVFGLTSGWWHLTDRDLRPDQPLMKREKWEEVLREVGFAETVSMPGMRSPHDGEGQIGVLARRKWDQPAPEQFPTTIEAPAQTSWVIFFDNSGLGARLADQLAAAGARCRQVCKGKEFASVGSDIYTIRAEDPDDWTKLFETWNREDPPQRFVYLWAIDEEANDDEVLMGIDALLHFSHALDQFLPAGGVRIDLVTRNAHAVGRDIVPPSMRQGATIGLFRVLLSEHPKINCRGIDLAAEASEDEFRQLSKELQRTESEREVALRGEARFVQRLTRGLPTGEYPLDKSVPLRLESRERGILDSLHFTPFEMPACAPGDVLIEVKAAAMNFRDVLKALGIYPAETEDARIFGDEVGGEVIAIGEGVTHVKPGDRVYGLAVFGLATHTLARAEDVLPIPDGITFEEASTIPVVFTTAWHALQKAARIRKGDIVLVHAGAGGVGMAAIQIAHHFGAKVIASAGNPGKRAFLKTLGVWEVIDSRHGDFTERVMELTDGRGVDIVLNALASEAIPMGLACLAEYGRFIEIGKRDIYQNSRLPLWLLRRNASFHVVAMDAVFAGDAALTKELLGEIDDLVEKAELTPLPYRSFPANRVDAAFRLMAAGKHTGKVVISFAEPFIRRMGSKPRPAFSGKPDATYLITGGLGGFGKVLAGWLIECGAKHLVLTGRRGAETPGAAEYVEELRERGVEALIVKADAGSRHDMKNLFEEVKATKRPLKGIFHLAMVVDDAPLADLTAERVKAVMEPKAFGAWLLHEATRQMDLDAFVMFSSISSIFGNPAQGNYSAANAFLDALSHHRHALGLHSLAINWGVLGGEGYVARNEQVAEFLARQGTEAIDPNEVTALLESFIEANVPQAAAIRVDWVKWRQTFRGLNDNPLLERIFASGVDFEESGRGSGDWQARIEAADSEDRDGLITRAVQDVVGSVLRVKPETLREDQPLTDLGLDSLMGVEIENLIESSIGVTLPPTSLMRARTIGQIATLISSHLGAGESQPVAPAADTPAPAEEVIEASEIDFDALSDQELDTLLDEAPAEIETAQEPSRT